MLLRWSFLLWSFRNAQKTRFVDCVRAFTPLILSIQAQSWSTKIPYAHYRTRTDNSYRVQILSLLCLPISPSEQFCHLFREESIDWVLSTNTKVSQQKTKSKHKHSTTLFDFWSICIVLSIVLSLCFPSFCPQNNSNTPFPYGECIRHRKGLLWLCFRIACFAQDCVSTFLHWFDQIIKVCLFLSLFSTPLMLLFICFLL